MKTISKEDAKDVLDNAMSDPCPANWAKAEKVFAALKYMFPVCTKAVTKVEERVGDAAQEIEEPMNGEAYYDKRWWQVMNAVDKMFEEK